MNNYSVQLVNSDVINLYVTPVTAAILVDVSKTTILVGTVSTLAAGASATVVNVGSTSQPILNFGLPQGAAGANGAAGATGATGPAGADTSHAAMAEDLLPSTTSTRSIGSSLKIWLAGWFDILNLPTTSATAGQIRINAARVFHSFGSGNLFVGALSGNFTTSGTGLNTGVGENTLNALTTGVANVAIGKDCLKSNTSGGSNIAIGYNALSTNTIASNLVAIGNGALSQNTGAGNTAIGFGAGNQNTSGTFNTYIGENAGSTVSTVSGVTAIGPYSHNTGTGADVTALGFQAVRIMTTASGVTAIGGSAGYDTSAGGVSNSTGNNNTYLGFLSNGTSGALTNVTAIGYLARVIASNTWIAGKLGTKQAISEGANAAMGLSVLVGGTVTVSNNLVTANSRIFLTSQVDGGTVGYVRVSARTAGTSFTITSSSGTDTSSIAWEIKEPA